MTLKQQAAALAKAGYSAADVILLEIRDSLGQCRRRLKRWAIRWEYEEARNGKRGHFYTLHPPAAAFGCDEWQPFAARLAKTAKVIWSAPSA